MTRILNLRLLYAVGLAAGCSYPNQPYGPTANVAVRGVKVAPQTIEFVAIGETKTLSATISPANATDQTISWQSTDSTVAGVDANGLVTAKAVGFGVFITVTTHDGRHEASANVSVNP
jgi:uncharacterized protein YjdB